ncbi:class I SAM-dependent methyltransferase [Luteolibacter ambystomatis]|uniref:Class I SAM-dependent methyltransferase n=1 Tax=Luteolibacter ambystomatis TaxID=2824561 RepID=A0A975G9F5_9BACT|nr:class I SAM-dependent methyltransferase [Luteolibacter ambystomatis]QUE51263.1 class I SAM-dependent methyltransferase [Luteolibacter ambystomatis]
MTSHSQITGWANPPRPTELAHRLLEDVLKPGDHVIDATCGNGHDTLFLARCVGDAGRVLAFDVQEAAIHSAKQLLQSKGVDARVAFHCESHAYLAQHTAPASIAAVMFNLGYLPGADHSIITRSSETLLALEAAAHVLRPGGWLCVVCYPGHEGGDDEAAEVGRWMEALAPVGWRVARYGMLGTRRPAPFLLTAVKPG